MENFDAIVLAVVTSGIIKSSLGEKYVEEWEYELSVDGGITQLIAWKGKNRRGRYKVVPLQSSTKEQLERILRKLNGQTV
jgi:hypothetical protein